MKTFKKQVFSTFVKAKTVIVEDHTSKFVDLGEFDFLGKLNEKKIIQEIRNVCKIDTTIIIEDIKYIDNMYEISLEKFVKNADLIS